MFSSPELTSRAECYSMSLPPQCYSSGAEGPWLRTLVKDPGQSARSVGGRLQLDSRTPLVQQNWSQLTVLSRHSVGTCEGNKLTCNLSVTACPLFSQLAEPLWTDSRRKVELACAS